MVNLFRFPVVTKLTIDHSPLTTEQIFTVSVKQLLSFLLILLLPSLVAQPG